MKNESMLAFRNKLKLLYLKDIFEKHTDVDHGITHKDLMRIMESIGIDVKERTLRDDITALQDYFTDNDMELTDNINREDGKEKAHLYQEITNRIMEQMEGGVIPWQKPWVSSGSCISYATGKAYSLLNQMLLGRPGEYATFKQIQAAGGYVRKGEKSSMVVFWKWIEQENEETGEKKDIPFLRYYNVFHIDQCEGLSAKHLQKLPESASADQTAETIIAGYIQRSGVKLQHEEGDRAFYRPSSDSITLPLLAQFHHTAEYYSTAFHEMVHSTGHKSRLDRLEKTAFFGSEAYSKEELIAEIGAAALVNHVGLENAHSFRNNAAYVQNWLQVLKNDKRFIVSAAGKAEKAVSLILG